jgi:hypothetical protein
MNFPKEKHDIKVIENGCYQLIAALNESAMRLNYSLVYND